MTLAVIWPIKSFDRTDQKSSPYFRTLVLSHMVHIVSIVRISVKSAGKGKGGADHLVGFAFRPSASMRISVVSEGHAVFSEPLRSCSATGRVTRERCPCERSPSERCRRCSVTSRLPDEYLSVEPEEMAHLIDGGLQYLERFRF